MIPPTIYVRLANADDVSSIGDVHRDSVKNLCASHYSQQQLEAWFEDRPPNMYVNAIKERRILLAAEQDSVLGFVEIRPGEIEKLFVRGNAVGRGIGGELLRLGIGRVRDKFQGAITALALLNARTFYEHYGFKRVGESSLLRGRLQTQIDVVRMELE
jgi:putative acetyltransferase